jgi:hypothetical protein
LWNVTVADFRLGSGLHLATLMPSLRRRAIILAE